MHATNLTTWKLLHPAIVVDHDDTLKEYSSKIVQCASVYLFYTDQGRSLFVSSLTSSPSPVVRFRLSTI